MSAFVLGFVLTAGFCLYAKESPDSEQVIAEVGGQKLTLGDLQQQQGGKLLQARYQYYMNQRKALDQLIDDKLIEIEATIRHLSSEQFLNTVVYKDLKDPTEDQLQVYYEGMEATESYESVRDRVLEHIRELRRERARAAYVKQLRSDARVQVLLAPPFADVNVKDAYARDDKNPPVTLVEFADTNVLIARRSRRSCKSRRRNTETGWQLCTKTSRSQCTTLRRKRLGGPMRRRARKVLGVSRCAFL